MARLSRLLIVLALGAALAASPALAQEIRINPVPPHTKPQWTQVPGVPQIFYAPNIPTDVFRYRGKYYFFWADYLYQGNQPSGPWKLVQEVPAVFHEINPAYFKTTKKARPPAPPQETAPIQETAPPVTAPPPEAAAPPEPALESAQPEAPASPQPAPEPPAAPAGGPPKPPKVM
jgi:hypothetical protein